MTKNTVPKIFIELYPGDDQPFWYTPDTTNDQSGIPVEEWVIVLGFRYGRRELLKTPADATIQIPLEWNSTDDRFEGSLPKATTLGMTPGAWTGAIWRTNANAQRMQVVLITTVVANVLPTTSTTATTTTTTP